MNFNSSFWHTNKKAIRIAIIGCWLLFLFQNITIYGQSWDKILARNDKHFLGGGQMLIWAPEHPQFLDKPGFWDHSCFLNYQVEPNFTITILDENLEEIRLTAESKSWLPSHLTLKYPSHKHLDILEKRALLPKDILLSHLRFTNNSLQPKKLHIIVWTCQQIQNNAQSGFPTESKNAHFISSHFRSGNRISWERHYNNENAQLSMKIGMVLGADQYATSTAINVSSPTLNYPDWKLTPFFEKMTKRGLPDEEHFDWQRNPSHFKGLLYIALHYNLIIPPLAAETFDAFCAIGPSEQEAIEAFDRTVLEENPVQISVNNWENFFTSVPEFDCSNPYFQKYYYYRWYGLRLNRINTDQRYNLPYPCIFEGVNSGWFRHHISYSAQAHILETRWMHDPEIARGSLLNFIEHQRSDGSFPGAIMTEFGKKPVGFYHANWGKVVRELHRIHPNQLFLQQAYQALTYYADHFDNLRDTAGTHMYDVINHWETGQEYSSRYLFAEPDADKGESFQLKGIDATVYIYELQKNLAWMAEELKDIEATIKWTQAAEKTGKSILNNMWNDEINFFVDVDPLTLEKSTVKAAVGFYPFFTDLITVDHLAALTDHLFNPNEFWTNYPVPSTSLDDPLSNMFGDWQQKRLDCPWNGRSWLMTTCHVCEALAYTAQSVDESLKPKAVELIDRFIRMLFIDGDINKPSSFEYYNPLNGKPPYFRGTDDYMHSWINDLIIKYVVGLQPMDNNRIVIDPLPFNLEYFTLKNVVVKGGLIKILWRKNQTEAVDKGLYIFVDGKLIKHLKEIRRYEFNL